MRILMLAATLASSLAMAAESTVTVEMNIVDGNGTVSKAGEMSVSESPYGLVFTPRLSGLPAGVHGFHIHANPSCAPGQQEGKTVAALGAGGHWDPDATKVHAGPYGNGHKGDLPALYVGADGKAEYPVLAPRLRSLSEVRGHALMLHAGGDNHADHPAPLGGGGARMACGVVGS
ncbi:superoxide dismutase family protein [Massilia endophytica]|uniref:superoxide dismutase family protein n=1 Tax=Massilia endophytica TaxID=2899220 RepID=UPI001E4A98B1|nr:superoxide dismutase family protein [Massilia endophytica]UGQ46288.1 superoxide dismutase family protein [Massilia endophytica]